jgi:excisionase family DNA binding protein
VANNRVTNAGLPRLVNIEVVADHLGVAPRYVRRLVGEQRIPFVKLGRLIRFDPDEVRAWLDEARVPGEERKHGARTEPVTGSR